MSKTDVAPPPINVPIVDARSGMPTRAMADFLYKLWERTGGSTSSTDSILGLMVSSPPPGAGSVNPGGSAPDLGQVAAFLEMVAVRQAGQIDALRKEVDALTMTLRQPNEGLAVQAGEEATSAKVLALTGHNEGLAAQARQDANAAQILMYTAALGRTIVPH